MADIIEVKSVLSSDRRPIPTKHVLLEIETSIGRRVLKVEAAAAAQLMAHLAPLVPKDDSPSGEE